MVLNRREFLKKAALSFATGVGIDTLFPFVTSRTKKSNYEDVIVDGIKKEDLPKGIICLIDLPINKARLTIVGVAHKKEYIDEHTNFVKTLIEDKKPEALLLESTIGVREPVYRSSEDSYFDYLAKSIVEQKYEIDIVDIGGMKRVSFFPFFIKDMIAGFSYFYTIELFIREFGRSDVKLSRFAFTWPISRLFADGGIFGLRNPYEIIYDYIEGYPPLNEKRAAEEWKRYPRAMQTDMFIARAIRKLSKTYGSMLMVVGAFHAYGTLYALTNGLSPYFSFVKDKINVPVLYKDRSEGKIEL